jgi:hypothetical protein
MRASLALHQGTLWIARLESGWRVVPHDLDGRALARGFAVPPEPGLRARVEALAVDADHRVWVADGGARRVRAFSAFGQELDGLPRGDADRPGQVGDPVGLAAQGVEQEALLLVAARGPRRHALQLVRPDGRLVASLRARGDAGEPFRSLSRCALRGRDVWACERGSGLVQAFRAGAFHAAFRAPAGGLPECVQPLSDGRLLLATGGEERSALWLLDGSGRPVRALARAGEGDGQVFEPEDLAVEEAPGSDRRTRVVVADRMGARLQVFNLEGDCYGAFGSARAGGAVEEGT